MIKGGLEPLTKVPIFKYTSNEKRKLFIGNLYPYAEYFINGVNSIPFDSYSYDGKSEYFNMEDGTQIVHSCSSSSSPLSFFTGGVVYELLSKKFTNVKIHDYCDATGDIDVALFPPKITSKDDYDMFFLNTDGKINSFYRDFTKWTFEKLVEQMKSIQIINRIEHLIKFEIEEYEDIPPKHKTADLGYNIQKIGKCYVVAFLNEDKSMFKFQVVCKIEDSHVNVIDHVVEIILPLPEDNIEFSPAADSYKQPVVNTIELKNQTFHHQKYNSLIDDNVNAYIERKNAYGEPNESQVVHKSINHVARLFYLFELIYQNPDAFELDKLTALLFLYGMRDNTKKELPFLHYYKRINGKITNIKVDTKFFLNAYFEIIRKNTYAYNTFKRTNPDYFMDDVDHAKLHARFLTELFNRDVFESSEGLLTFQEEKHSIPIKSKTPPTSTKTKTKTKSKTKTKTKNRKTQSRKTT
jgi:hypothetical protein